MLGLRWRLCEFQSCWSWKAKQSQRFFYRCKSLEYKTRHWSTGLECMWTRLMCGWPFCEKLFWFVFGQARYVRIKLPGGRKVCEELVCQLQDTQSDVFLSLSQTHSLYLSFSLSLSLSLPPSLSLSLSLSVCLSLFLLISVNFKVKYQTASYNCLHLLMYWRNFLALHPHIHADRKTDRQADGNTRTHPRTPSPPPHTHHTHTRTHARTHSYESLHLPWAILQHRLGCLASFPLLASKLNHPSRSCLIPLDTLSLHLSFHLQPHQLLQLCEVEVFEDCNYGVSRINLARGKVSKTWIMQCIPFGHQLHQVDRFGIFESPPTQKTREYCRKHSWWKPLLLLFFLNLSSRPTIFKENFRLQHFDDLQFHTFSSRTALYLDTMTSSHDLIYFCS